MTDALPTAPIAFSSDIAVSLYTSEYNWNSDEELDITADVKRSGSYIEMNTSNDFMLSLRLRNHNQKYIDTTSDYYMFRGKRLILTFNGQTYKFIVSKTPATIKTDTVDIECLGHTHDMNGHIAQVRVQPASDGFIYLEDVLYRALFDTGLHNFFQIKNADGDVYEIGRDDQKKISLSDRGELVYWGMTVKDILNDLCSRAGCIWYMSDNTTSDNYSYINIVDMVTDYDVPTSNILYVSGYDNISDIVINRDPMTVTNYIYIDNLGIKLTEQGSIDEFGQRSPLKLSAPGGADMSSFLEYAHKYLEVAKNPEATITMTTHRFTSVTHLNYHVKVIDQNGDYDTASGFDRKYRLSSLRHSLDTEKTAITCGTLGRSKRLEYLKLLINGDSGTQTENESRRLVKGETIRLQVYSGYESVSDLSNASDFGLYGCRIGVDYLYHATASSPSCFYFDDDGVRNGN